MPPEGPPPIDEFNPLPVTRAEELYPPERGNMGLNPDLPGRYQDRVRERPKGWRPVVLDKTKTSRFRKDRATPAEVALAKDAVERVAEQHPHAARLLSRVEIVDDPHTPASGSYIVSDGLGSSIKLNLRTLRKDISELGLGAVDATLIHELTHAAQKFLGKDFDMSPAYSKRPHEISAFTRESKYMGKPITEMFPPLTPREAKYGSAPWRSQHPSTAMSAPKTPRIPRGSISEFYTRFNVSSEGNGWAVYDNAGKRISPSFKTGKEARAWGEENANRLLLTNPPVDLPPKPTRPRKLSMSPQEIIDFIDRSQRFAEEIEGLGVREGREWKKRL